jgi:uncharacterized protein
MIRRLFAVLAFATFAVAPGWCADAAKKKILFFTKSSGFENSVISWSKGQPSHAEKVLLELGAKNGWEFTFSKDGSKFGKEYLAQFDAVFFYTTGDLTTPGTDKQPPMTVEGKQALFDYVRSGRGFVGTHSAADTFHTANESKKGPDRYVNHGEKADAYVRFLGGEFIKHGAQQKATNKVTNPKFPGFEQAGPEFTLHEEWYSLKDFAPDLHVLTVIDAPSMQGVEYQRPPYPTTWARTEGKGRVWFTALGHREDVWTNPSFQHILTGGIKWALGEVKAEVPPNLQQAAPGALTNPPFPEPKPKADKAGAAPVETAAATELEGEWRPVSIRNGDDVVPAAKLAELKFTFRGNRHILTHTTLNATESKATVRLNPATTPKQIDMELDEQPAAEKQPKIVGIYRLEGDRLTIAFSRKAISERPKAFPSAGEAGVEVVTLQRVAPGTK